MNDTTSAWLSASEVRKRFEAAFGDAPSILDRKLRRFAGHGVLQIKARSARISDFGSVLEKQDWVVEGEFLSPLRDGTSRAQINIVNESLRCEIAPTYRLDCVGLAFARTDIDAVCPPIDPPVHQGAGVRKGGGRLPDKKAWTQFSAALAVVAAKDEDDLGNGRSAASVYDAVMRVLQARLGPDAPGLSEDNVRDAISLAQDWWAHGVPQA